MDERKPSIGKMESVPLHQREWDAIEIDAAPGQTLASMQTLSGHIDARRFRINATSVAILLAFALLWLLVVVYRPSFSLSYPLFFAPFTFLIYRSHKTGVVAADDTIRTFAIAFAAAPVVLFVMVICLIFLHPVFDQVKSVYVTIFLILLCQVAGEEAFKFVTIRNQIRKLDSESSQEQALRLSDLRHCLFSSMAISLGYGTYQGLATSALLTNGGSNVVSPLLISGLIAFLYIPFHVMTGYLIGLQLGRKAALNENVHSAFVVIPVVGRTLFLYQFFFWAMRTRHPFVWWTMTSTAIIVGFAYYIRFVKKRLPAEFLNSAGYNQLLGYIPIVDDEYHSSS